MDSQQIELITLTRTDLEDLIGRTAARVAEELREDVQRPVPEIMTKQELAEYLRCDTSKINRYMKDGLPFLQFGGHPRFRKSSIDRWLDLQKIQRQAA